MSSGGVLELDWLVRATTPQKMSRHGRWLGMVIGVIYVLGTGFTLQPSEDNSAFHQKTTSGICRVYCQ